MPILTIWTKLVGTLGGITFYVMNGHYYPLKSGGALKVLEVGKG